MPVDGFNNVRSGYAANVARSVVRASTGSTSDQLVGTSVSRPALFTAEGDTGKKAFDGTVNGGIEGLSSMIAASGRVMGAASERRKLAEIGLGKVMTGDEMHVILDLTERDISTFQRTLDGRFIVASGGDGTFVNPTGNTTIDMERVNGSGDFAAKTRFEDQGRIYTTVGNSKLVKGLEVRSI